MSQLEKTYIEAQGQLFHPAKNRPDEVKKGQIERAKYPPAAASSRKKT